MKDFRTRHTTIVLAIVWLISAWTASLAIMAEGQTANENAEKQNRAVTPSESSEPGKAGTTQSSMPVATASQSAAPKALQQPAKQTEDKSAASNQEEGGTASEKNKQDTNYSWRSVGIAGLMIVVLGWLFWLQFIYQRKLDQTTYLGEIYYDSVLTFERGRLGAQYADKWAKHGYHQEAIADEPPPSLDKSLAEFDERFGYGDLQSLKNRYISEAFYPGSTVPVGESAGRQASEGDSDPLRKEYEIKASDFRRRFKEWKEQIETKARQAYQGDLEKARFEAEKRTDTAINLTEVSLLRGQGPQFVLEFTALIVIIFLAVVLGVLGVLKEQQLGTLLAAIAGYVLGRATASSRGAKTEDASREQKPREQKPRE